MKLNYDCVRDLLLYLEDNLTYENTININSLKLKEYSSLDLVYTADKLCEADFIDCIRSRHIDQGGPIIIAKSITYEGHQFIDTVRDNKVWKETKNIASSVASTSLKVIENIASQVITNIVTKQIGLN